MRRDRTDDGLGIPIAYAPEFLGDGKVRAEAKGLDRLGDVRIAQVNSGFRFSGLEIGRRLNFRAGPLKEAGLKRGVPTRTCKPPRRLELKRWFRQGGARALGP